MDVSTAYALQPKSKANGQSYGFRLGAYDKSKPLVIDPVMLIYAGYLGGAYNDPALDIAVDLAGNAYITGMTTSVK